MGGISKIHIRVPCRGVLILLYTVKQDIIFGRLHLLPEMHGDYGEGNT